MYVGPCDNGDLWMLKPSFCRQGFIPPASVFMPKASEICIFRDFAGLWREKRICYPAKIDDLRISAFKNFSNLVIRLTKLAYLCSDLLAQLDRATIPLMVRLRVRIPHRNQLITPYNKPKRNSACLFIVQDSFITHYRHSPLIHQE